MRPRNGAKWGGSKTRNLGLDVGDRKIGVALSDPDGILASPLTIIDYHDEMAAIKAIVEIVEREKVGHIIIGLPRSMDGSLGEQARKVEGFAERLSSHTVIPIEFRDERLTTVSARRLMKSAGNKKSGKPARDDAIAAAIILQGYIDEGKDYLE
ncbi:MAG: Holliday junction resolvase RuvX [Chloroflexi bacterium]|nr:Holliday junction resolvase RuvX [Chloroflexota bacterium]